MYCKYISLRRACLYISRRNTGDTVEIRNYTQFLHYCFRRDEENATTNWILPDCVVDTCTMHTFSSIPSFNKELSAVEWRYFRIWCAISESEPTDVRLLRALHYLCVPTLLMHSPQCAIRKNLYLPTTVVPRKPKSVSQTSWLY